MCNTFPPLFSKSLITSTWQSSASVGGCVLFKWSICSWDLWQADESEIPPFFVLCGESQIVLLPGSHGSPLQVPLFSTDWGGPLGPATPLICALFVLKSHLGKIIGKTAHWKCSGLLLNEKLAGFHTPPPHSLIDAGFTQGRGSSFHFKSFNSKRASSAFGRPDLLLCTVGPLLGKHIGDSWTKCLELIAVGLCLKFFRSEESCGGGICTP